VVIDDESVHYEGIAVAEVRLCVRAKEVVFVPALPLAPYMEAILIGGSASFD